MMDKIKLASVLFLLALAIALAGAVPVPMGIEGSVYLSNGSGAGRDTSISFTNLNNSQRLESNIRQDSTFSFVIPGDYGDYVLLEASMGGRNSSQLIVLSGSLHNISLYLDIQREPIVAVSDLYSPKVVVGTTPRKGSNYRITNKRTGQTRQGVVNELGGYVEVIRANPEDEIVVEMSDDEYIETRTAIVSGDVVRLDFTGRRQPGIFFIAVLALLPFIMVAWVGWRHLHR